MNKRLGMIRIAVPALCLLFLLGCARTPNNKTSERIIKKYFIKYGHKYKESDFGKYKVDSVDVASTEEIHKHMVATKALVKLSGGPTYQVRCVIDKKTLGWRVEAWENLQQ